MPETQDWLRKAAILVVTITMVRIVGLAFARTDLFVDESQYWLWAQSLDLGYFSKPPLIAWVIRAFTEIGGDSTLWVRLPGPIFHAVTAIILGFLAERIGGARAAFWTCASYVTLPFVAVGSALISTDTIMAPFYAGALLAYFRLVETKAVKFALMAGALAGLAFLAKYAAIYLLLGALLASILPAFRPGFRNAAFATLAFLVVISPNLIWNATHSFETVGHTMDNVGWVKESQGPGLNFFSLAEFVAAQFIVFGPVLFVALLMAARKAATSLRALTLFSLPVVAVVSVQALLSRAYANWAVGGYFAGTVAAVLVLLDRPRLLRLSLALGLVVSVAVPAAIVAGPLIGGPDRPLLHRYLGRAELSREAIGIAKFQGASAIVAADRDVLADLFYTGRDSGLAFYATPAKGAPGDYYQQMHALPAEAKGLVLAILVRAPVCNGRTVPAIQTFDTSEGAHFKRNYAAYLVGANCISADD